METLIYFPTEDCSVHPDIKGKDFHTIQNGDIAFISNDANGTSIPLIFPISKDGKELDAKKQ